MVRFSALPSDSSDEDVGYAPHEPAIGKFVPSPPRPGDGFGAGGRDEEEEDEEEDDGEYEEEDASSALESSHMGEDELMESPPRRRRRDRKALLEGPDGEYYHPHELEDADDSSTSSSSGSFSGDEPMFQSRDLSVIPRAQQVGVDTQKMHAMQASLFRVPEEAEAIRQLNTARPSVKRFSLAPSDAGAPARGLSAEPDVGMRDLVAERALLPLDVLAPGIRPARKFPRVEAASSFVVGAEGAFVDAGLAFGRSFRVGWAPGGSLVHVGRICGPYGESRASANSSVVTKAYIPFSQSLEDAEDLSTKLLPLHLAKSPITFDDDHIPCANPSPDLRFATFAGLFPAADRSFEASLFRLGHALFDDLDLRLHSSVDAHVAGCVEAIRKKAALSNWLEDAVAPSVEADLKGNPALSAAAKVYLLLSGHQVEQACDVALGDGDVRLATLVSQAGGDARFKEEIGAQLQIWRQQRVDAHIDPQVRRIYALLAGLCDVLEGSDGPGGDKRHDISLTQDLDWKRVLGLHLWYSQPLDATIAEVCDAFNQHWQDFPERTAAPRPWYQASPAPSPPLWNPPPGAETFDALYNLIQLYTDENLSLSSVLDPLSFSQSPVDYALPWHLYILLSRCMKYRDFADRDNPEDRTMDQDIEGSEEPRIDGHSPSADLLTSSYAHQLEQLGLIQEATFVLLHIESSMGREQAVKDLLIRSAPRLDDWMTRGLAGSLKIPLAWINEAMAISSLSNGSVYEAYQLYLQGELYNEAHELAVVQLAPEAVIRDDLVLLKSLFEKIAGHPVDGWHVRGKAYLDYATIMMKIPDLRGRVQDPGAVPDASETVELEELVRAMPKLLGILPDLLRDQDDPRHRAALAEMTANITRELDLTRPLVMSTSRLRMLAADEATQLLHLQTAVSERFLSSFQ